VLATSTGLQTLGVSATATDVFTFTCPTGTISASANVTDIAAHFPFFNVPARMRVMLVKDHGAAQAEDVLPLANGGEDGPASGNAVLAKGPGLYHMMFFKTAPGTEAYIGNVVCNSIFLPPFNPVFAPLPQPSQNQ
jgi:hypothetical protein